MDKERHVIWVWIFLMLALTLLVLLVSEVRAEDVLVGSIVPLGGGQSELFLLNEAQTQVKNLAVDLFVNGEKVNTANMALARKASITLKMREDRFSSLPPDQVWVAVRGLYDLSGIVAGLKRIYGGVEYFSFLSPWTTWSRLSLKETPLLSAYAVGMAAMGDRPFRITTTLLATNGKLLASREYPEVIPGTQDGRYLWQHFVLNYQSWVNLVGEDSQVIFLVTCGLDGRVAVNIAKVTFPPFAEEE